jgi:hypothetical protein
MISEKNTLFNLVLTNGANARSLLRGKLVYSSVILIYASLQLLNMTTCGSGVQSPLSPPRYISSICMTK